MIDLLLPPNKLQMEAIREDLGEDEDRLANNLKLFEKWISCNAHLPQNYDKRNLPIFLRGCKHDLSKAQKKFEMYYTLRNYISESFGNEPNGDGTKQFVDTCNVIPVPKMTPDGKRVSILGLHDPDPNKFSIKDAIAWMSMIYNVRLVEEHPHCGEILVFDGSHFKAAHAAKFVSIGVKNYLALTRKAYPIRIPEVHVINPPGLVAWMLQVLRPHIHARIRDRIIIHKDSKTLFDHIPEEIIPEDLGGKEQSSRTLMKRWHSCLKRHEQWFKEQESVICRGPIPESVYQSCGLQFDDAFGVTGSFRQLAID